MPSDQPEPVVSTTLSYARRSHVSAFKRRRRALTAGLILCAIGLFIYRVGPTISQRVQFQYWMYKCEHVQMPPAGELVIWDLAHIQQVLRHNVDYQYNGVNINFGQQSASFVPHAWIKLKQLEGFSPTFGIDEPVAFIGTLRRPDGIRRLVVMEGTQSDGPDLLHRVKVTILPIPDWFQNPRAQSLTKSTLPGDGATEWAYDGLWLPVNTTTVVRDPNDDSHLILQLVADVGDVEDTNPTDQPLTIDARLGTDDRLHYTVRNESTLSAKRIELSDALRNGSLRN